MQSQINNIKKIVANHFEISVQAMESKSRAREVCLPRQIAMYIIKELHKEYALRTVGAAFCNRDHSTVLHAIDTVNDLMYDKKLKETVSDLIYQCYYEELNLNKLPNDLKGILIGVEIYPTNDTLKVS